MGRLCGVGSRARPTRVWAAKLLAFGLAFAVRSLYAVDLFPQLGTSRQPGIQMTRRYDAQALEILRGEGVLFPRRPDPADTGLLSRPPGYSLLLAALYAGLGRSLASTQLAQNLLAALAAPLMLAAGRRLVSFRVGAIAAGAMAVAPHFAWFSSWIVPDALCLVPFLLGLLSLWRSRRSRRPRAWCAAAGLAFGAGTWLRPNLLLLGVAAGLGFFLARPSRERARRAALTACVSLLVVAPITLRNYLVFGAFVPVSTNFGLVLWEGIAEAGGERFGAARSDNEVAREEARRHGDPRYRSWWAAPDGIARDRERTRRAFRVIAANPLWFARATGRRMLELLDYAASAPPSVALEEPPPPERGPDVADESTLGLAPRLADGVCLRPGRALAFARPVVAALQEAVALTWTPAAALGAVLLCFLATRRAILLGTISLSFLLLQAPLRLELRMALPLHTISLLLAAVAWAALFGVLVRGRRVLAKKPATLLR